MADVLSRLPAAKTFEIAPPYDSRAQTIVLGLVIVHYFKK
jgi:hypothetical protein